MTGLWLGIIALLLLACLILFLPLMPFYRRRVFEKTGHQQENIGIFKDRLEELEIEKDQGNLDETAFQLLKTELEKSLLQDASSAEIKTLQHHQVSGQHWMVISSIALAVGVGSLGMYVKIGRSDDLAIFMAVGNQATHNQTVATKEPQGGQAAPDMTQAVAMLEAKVKQNPEDTQKQYLLANSYAAIGQFDKAAVLYANMAEKAGANSEEYAKLLGARAQVVYQAQGERFTDEVKQAIDQALAADPQESSALMILGIQAFRTEQYEQAVEFWEQSLVKAHPGQKSQFIEPAIAAAKNKLGLAQQPTTVAAAKQTTDNSATAAKSVVIDLSLAEALRSKVSPEAVIFVFARPVGGRMPLAVERIKVRDLPRQIILDDSKAAMPTAKLSSVNEVDITARVSLSGQPMAQKGDLYTSVEKLALVGRMQMQLVIDKVVE